MNGKIWYPPFADYLNGKGYVFERSRNKITVKIHEMIDIVITKHRDDKVSLVAKLPPMYHKIIFLDGELFTKIIDLGYMMGKLTNLEIIPEKKND